MLLVLFVTFRSY